MSWLGEALVWLAALPLAMAAINLPLLLLADARDRRRALPPDAAVSILIPARNEAANIEPCVRAALATEGVAVEVLVMDDGSEDGTGEIVARLAEGEPRLRLLRAPPLPPRLTMEMPVEPVAVPSAMTSLSEGEASSPSTVFRDRFPPSPK